MRRVVSTYVGFVDRTELDRLSTCRLKRPSVSEPVGVPDFRCPILMHQHEGAMLEVGSTYFSTRYEQTPGSTRCNTGDFGGMTTKSGLSVKLNFTSFPSVPFDLHAPCSEHVVGRDSNEKGGSCKDCVFSRDTLDKVNQLSRQLRARGTART